MGTYPETEDRDSTVVNLESYRRRREIAAHDTDANQKLREGGEDGAVARNAPVEGNHKDRD